MFIQKNNLFLSLSKNQKANLISYLKNFTKKNASLSVEEIFYAFQEDESYYFNVGNPHFEWIIEEFEKDSFEKEVRFLISQYKEQITQKELQKPFLEKQKAYAKEQRKKAQEFKMSKEKPTPKQLKYYKNLCKKYNIPPKEEASLSKLDLKNLINEILVAHEKDAFECLKKNL